MVEKLVQQQQLPLRLFSLMDEIISGLETQNVCTIIAKLLFSFWLIFGFSVGKYIHTVSQFFYYSTCGNFVQRNKIYVHWSRIQQIRMGNIFHIEIFVCNYLTFQTQNVHCGDNLH